LRPRRGSGASWTFRWDATTGGLTCKLALPECGDLRLKWGDISGRGKVAPEMTTSLTVVLAFVFTAEPADDEAMSALNEHHRHHHHGGITQFVEMSLDTLGEDAAKHAQVEKLQEALHECMEPVEDEEERVLLALADGVGSGTVDAAKVDAAVK